MQTSLGNLAWIWPSEPITSGQLVPPFQLLRGTKKAKDGVMITSEAKKDLKRVNEGLQQACLCKSDPTLELQDGMGAMGWFSLSKASLQDGAFSTWQDPLLDSPCLLLCTHNEPSIDGVFLTALKVKWPLQSLTDLPKWRYCPFPRTFCCLSSRPPAQVFSINYQKKLDNNFPRHKLLSILPMIDTSVCHQFF